MNPEPTPSSTLRPPPCCSCQATNSRCATPACPCYSTNQKCRPDCGVETTTTTTTPSFVAGDFCLNRPAVVCRCQKSPAIGDFLTTTTTATYQRFSGEDGDDFEEEEGDYRDRWSLKSADMSITETDLKGGENFSAPGESKLGVEKTRNACTNRQCDCYKFRERCTDECRCKGECSNVAAPKMAPSGERPQMNCKCKGGKSKSCLKDEKCPCRQLLNYCTKFCKCKCDCSNSARNAARLSKNAKLCLISPEQPANFGSVRLTSEIYDYQFAYCSTDKYFATAASSDDKHVEEAIYHKIMTILNNYQVPLRKIDIYLSKSPCYHQYCRPECGTLSTCDDNKCCARTLAVMARQARRRLKDHTVEVSVKILMVDGTRGDLYTNKSLTTMLKAGVNVEPLCMKEWSQFIFDRQPVGRETDGRRNSDDNRGEQNSIEDFCAQAKNTWSVCQMDTYLLQTQQYINKSRLSLGLKKSYWCSRLHELLKTSVRSTYESRRLFDDLESKLEKLTRRRHHFRSTMTLLSSLIGLGVGEGRESSPTTTPTNVNVASAEISPILAKNRSLKIFDKNLPTIDQKRCKTPPISVKKYVKRSNTGPLIALSKQLSIFRNKSTSNTILNDQTVATTSRDDDCDERPKTPAVLSRSSSFLHLRRRPKENDEKAPDSKKEDIDRLILAISGRNITEEEKTGMIKEISECVEDIKMRLDFFMDLLEMKITSTSL